MIDVTGGTGVALENFSVLGASGTSGATPMIAARGVVDFSCTRLNAFGIAVGDGISAGIGLSRLMLRATVTECVLVAQRGMAFVPRERGRRLPADGRARHHPQRHHLRPQRRPPAGPLPALRHHAHRPAT